jgi:hypothetical protein
MSSLVINSSKYAIYVRVLGGQGDGPLITVDAQGHIHVVGDPGPLPDRVAAAVRQIEIGAAEFQAATQGLAAGVAAR